MREADSNGRTHEPSLRELTAELDGAKNLLQAKLDSLRELVNERHQRYDERFKAQDTSVASALAAADKQTGAAFLSSEKAITKAEDAQREYNARTNELRGSMSDQAARMVSKPEADSRFDALSEKLEDQKAGTETKFVAMKQEWEKRTDELRTEIAGLRESRSEIGGKAIASESAHQQKNWGLGIVVAIGASLLATLVGVTAIVIELSKK